MRSTKFDVMRAADALVFAAEEIRADVAEVFKAAPATLATFGVAADVEAVRAAAEAEPTPARNAAGALFARGERGVVGMCGHASARKGADIFLELAAASPDWDFLWVGGWRPDETPDNIAYDDYVARALPNLYVAGAVDNPFPHMKAMDLFFLSSREDPNPLVVAEAAILGAPLLCFSHATAVADRLGRSALMCYGAPNVADAARILAALTPEQLRAPAFRAAAESVVAEYDLKQRMPAIRALIARLRAPEPEREVA
jgi:glycosyltransferase involved in cell wall biosynthesis